MEMERGSASPVAQSSSAGDSRRSRMTAG